MQLNSQHENVFTMSRAQQWASVTFPAIYSLLPSYRTRDSLLVSNPTTSNKHSK